MAGVQVEGVREAIIALRQIEPTLAREAIKRIKVIAEPARAALEATVPEAPLSHIEPDKKKVVTKYGGRRQGEKGKSGEFPLVRIRLTAPGWTVAADMARKSAAGESFTTNLLGKYGAASRWVWPTVEPYAPAMVMAIKLAAEEMQAEVNRRLA